jgi:hypothetical protein
MADLLMDVVEDFLVPENSQIKDEDMDAIGAAVMERLIFTVHL